MKEPFPFWNANFFRIICKFDEGAQAEREEEEEEEDEDEDDDDDSGKLKEGRCGGKKTVKISVEGEGCWKSFWLNQSSTGKAMLVELECKLS
ncbi:hypothetical protein RUM43_012326 [Polyplax serrata]|uniref:Uncharacterized protein n=1 Tax=Polyplax serrata TaxID=468196 RepID=A0AAN8NRF9_POLSC